MSTGYKLLQYEAVSGLTCFCTCFEFLLKMAFCLVKFSEFVLLLLQQDKMRILPWR